MCVFIIFKIKIVPNHQNPSKNDLKPTRTPIYYLAYRLFIFIHKSRLNRKNGEFVIMDGLKNKSHQSVDK